MKARLLWTVIVMFGALANAGCMVDSQGDQESITDEQEVGTVQSAVSTWTGWSSGSCGSTGCTPIVSPTCANGMYAKAFERNSAGTSYRILCETVSALTATNNHTWNTSCPAGKVGTGIQCITTSTLCTPQLRCSTPVGKVTSEPYTLASQSGNTFSCSNNPSVRYLKQARFVSGVCGVLFNF